MVTINSIGQSQLALPAGTLSSLMRPLGVSVLYGSALNSLMGPPGPAVLFASTLNLLTRLPCLPVLSVSAPNFLTRFFVQAFIGYIGAPEKDN